MKRVYTTESLPMVWHMRNVLEQHDIETVIRNDKLFSVAGEVPVTECLPEIWVKNMLDFERAERLINELENSPEILGEDWDCGTCGESNGSNFHVCWNCQTADTREA